MLSFPINYVSHGFFIDALYQVKQFPPSPNLSSVLFLFNHEGVLNFFKFLFFVF